ncbi:hypothetical protein BDZ97DRAFT_1753922 [Flammula alnicola]|nr:hypothetical protein BDZ97DRAFT_1753922 [Flammula alnicola]
MMLADSHRDKHDNPALGNLGYGICIRVQGVLSLWEALKLSHTDLWAGGPVPRLRRLRRLRSPPGLPTYAKHDVCKAVGYSKYAGEMPPMINTKINGTMIPRYRDPEGHWVATQCATAGLGVRLNKSSNPLDGLKYIEYVA